MLKLNEGTRPPAQVQCQAGKHKQLQTLLYVLNSKRGTLQSLRCTAWTYLDSESSSRISKSAAASCSVSLPGRPVSKCSLYSNRKTVHAIKQGVVACIQYCRVWGGLHQLCYTCCSGLWHMSQFVRLSPDPNAL